MSAWRWSETEHERCVCAWRWRETEHEDCKSAEYEVRRDCESCSCGSSPQEKLWSALVLRSVQDLKPRPSVARCSCAADVRTADECAPDCVTRQSPRWNDEQTAEFPALPDMCGRKSVEAVKVILQEHILERRVRQRIVEMIEDIPVLPEVEEHVFSVCRRGASKRLGSSVACPRGAGGRLRRRITCLSTKSCTAGRDSRAYALWTPRVRGKLQDQLVGSADGRAADL